METIGEYIDLIISSVKNTSNIEIRETISYSSECLIPKFVSESLIRMSLFSYPDHSSYTNRKESKTDERHTNIDDATYDNQDNGDTYLWYYSEKEIVSSLPYCFSTTIDDFLFFSRLNPDMIFNREKEHFLHSF